MMMFKEKSITKQAQLMNDFVYAITRHKPTDDIIYVLSVQSPRHFLKSLTIILQDGFLDITCLDLCLQHVLLHKSPPPLH